MRNFAQDIISSVGVLIYLKQTKKTRNKTKKTGIETTAVIMVFSNGCES